MLFSCNECVYQNKCKRLLVGHLRSLHCFPETKFICDLCSSVQFKSYQGLLNHISSDHSDQVSAPRELYRCEKCPKQFREKKDLVLHLCSIHNDVAQEKCVCDICFAQKSRHVNVALHITSVHSQLVSNKLRLPWKCDGCPGEFKRKQHILQHRCQLFHQDPIFCDICRHKVVAKRNFSKHYARIHLKEKRTENVYCDNCPATVSKNSIATHLLTHEKNLILPLCNDCGCSQRKSDLMRHWMRRHSNLPKKRCTFICDSCRKTYVHRRSLARHSAICG